MRLKGLMDPLIENQNFNEVMENVRENNFPVGVYGISESGKGYFINGVYENQDKPMVVVTHSDVEARNIYEDLNLYTSEVYYFPTKEVVFYNIDAISGDLRWARLKVIKEILNCNKKIIVTSIEAFACIYTPIELYRSHSFTLKLGEELDLRDLSKTLTECGYERLDMVEGKGEFSLRGGILDVFPPT